MAKIHPSRYECTRSFFRAAVQRFDEAQFLFDNSGHPSASVYLAGYAVECALKAVLLARTPAMRHPATKATFRGKVAHSFEWWKQRLKLLGSTLPDVVTQHLARGKLVENGPALSAGTGGSETRLILPLFGRSDPRLGETEHLR